METKLIVLITTLLMFALILLRLIINNWYFNIIVKYSGIDEIDLLKQETRSGQAEILTRKLAEKACLLSYRTLKAMDKLEKIGYLSTKEYEQQKKDLRSYIEKTTPDYIIIPKTNPALLKDLNLFEPELFSEFKKITAEQKHLRHILITLMPRIFNYKPQ